LEGKLYIGGNSDNELRLSLSYEPLLDFTSTYIHDIRASAELGFGLGEYSNTILYIGAKFGLRLENQGGNTIMGIPELNCFLRLKLD
jgi:hypothetical protein